jgi:hypothetical protein
MVISNQLQPRLDCNIDALIDQIDEVARDNDVDRCLGIVLPKRRRSLHETQ